MSNRATRIVRVLIVACVAVLFACALTGCGGSSSGADFDDKGIKINMEQGESYDYTTVCYGDESKTTVGQAEVVSQQVVSSDSDHEAKAGYEWQLVTIQLTFSDDNAWNYGFKYYYRLENFYDIAACENDTYDKTTGTSTFTITVDEQQYECTMKTSSAMKAWTTDSEGKHSRVVDVYYEMQVPEGYDGMVCGLMNAKLMDQLTYVADDDDVKDGGAVVGGKKPFDKFYNTQDFLFYRVK